MAGQASDIRAGGAFVELYLKGDKKVLAGLDLLSAKADRFVLVLGTMGKASRVAFGQVSIASKAMGAAVSKSIGVAVKSTKALNAQMSALLLSSRRVLPGIASSFSRFGRQMMMFGTTGAIGAGFSVMTFAKFEAGMSKVRAITGATAEKMKELQEQAKELGQTTFFTASQVADAQKFLAMAGFTPDQILKATPQVLDLALAGDMDLGMAADIATNISTPFKIAAKDLGRVNDILARAANSSNTNVEEMGQAFKYAAPAAAAAGQSIEEMGAAMALMANNGIKADMAGTSIRQMMIKLADKNIRQKLKDQFNIDVADQSGKMKPLLSIIQELEKSTSKMNDIEGLSEFFSIFEARAGNSAVALAGVTDQIEDFRHKMNTAAGTAAEMARVMADNLKGSWIALMSAVEGAQIAFGEVVTPMLRKVFDETTKSVRAFSAWLTENKEIAVSFTAITAGVLATGSALALLGGALATVSTILTPLMITATGLVIGVGSAATMAIGMIGTALTATVTAVAAIPGVITAAITAISALSTAAFAVLSSTVSAIVGIPAMIKGAVMIAVGSFQMLKASVIAAIKATISAISVGMQIVETTAIVAMSAAATTAITAQAGAATAAMVAQTSTMLALSTAATAMIVAQASAASLAIGVETTAIVAMSAAATTAITAQAGAAMTTATAIGARAIASTAASASFEIIDVTFTIVSETSKAASASASSASSILSSFISAYSSIAAAASSAMAYIGAAAISAAAQIKIAVLGAISQIIAFLPGILIVGSAIAAIAAISYGVYKSLGQIAKFITEATTGIKNAFISIGNVIISSVRGLFSAVSAMASSLGRAFLGVFSAIGKGFGVIVGAVSKNIDTIRSKIDDLMADAVKSGKELYESFNLVIKLLTEGEFETAMAIVWKEIQIRISDAKILAIKAVKTLIGNLPKIVSVLGEVFSVVVTELKTVFSDLMKKIMLQVDYILAILEESVLAIKIEALKIGSLGGTLLSKENKDRLATRKEEAAKKTEEARQKAFGNQDPESERQEINSLIKATISKADILGGLDDVADKEQKQNESLRAEMSDIVQKATGIFGESYDVYGKGPVPMSLAEGVVSLREEEIKSRIISYESAEDKRTSGVSYFDYKGAKRELSAIQNIRSKQAEQAKKQAEYQAKMEARRNGTAPLDQIGKAQAKIRQVAATDYVAQITGSMSKGTFSAFEAASGFSAENKLLDETETQTGLLRKIAENTKDFSIMDS